MIKYSILISCLLSLVPTHGAVILFAEYHLGEAGSLGTDNRPQDSSGNARHFTANNFTSTTVATSGVFAPGSTHYLSTTNSNADGFYGATGYSNATLGTDNFAFGIYVRAASNTASTQGDIFTLGDASASNTYKVAMTSNGWEASSTGSGGAIGSAVAVSNNTWVHLAVIRSGGQSAFYVNGIQQGGTNANAPVIGSPFLSVNPGGAVGFDGHLDELRVVTFTAGESTANIMYGLTTVPEPSALLLGGIGVLALLRRRRN